MLTTHEQFESYLKASEGSHFEFKEAKADFSFDKLVKYAVALANEGGGKILLGITDKKPRKVVASQAFPHIERTKQGLIERLHLKIEAEEYSHPDGRVLIFHIPSRPLGVAIQYEGAYWMRIADTLARCGLVERSGQGFDRIYKECLRNAKPPPDFSRTDEWFVNVTLHGQIHDERFLRFLEKVGKERVDSFTAQDFLVLDHVRREEKVPSDLKPWLTPLAEEGLIEWIGQGRGVRYLLTRKFFQFTGRTGVYTRKHGLDKQTNKALLLKHIRDSAPQGSPFSELQQVLPTLSRRQVQWLLHALRTEGKAMMRGAGKGSRWHSTGSIRICTRFK